LAHTETFLLCKKRGGVCPKLSFLNLQDVPSECFLNDLVFPDNQTDLGCKRNKVFQVVTIWSGNVSQGIFTEGLGKERKEGRSKERKRVMEFKFLFTKNSPGITLPRAKHSLVSWHS
jgi:hypothetical protein